MLEEFHNPTENTGLHNPRIRSLRSPIPLLVIRTMPEADLPFFQSYDNLNLTIGDLEAYLRLFGDKFTDKTKFKSCQQALALTKVQLKPETLVSY
jgi:hypothetical protein